jgi:hypothetical protein
MSVRETIAARTDCSFGNGASTLSFSLTDTAVPGKSPNEVSFRNRRPSGRVGARSRFLSSGLHLDAGRNGVSCLSWINGEFLYYDQWHLRLNLKPETRREFAKALRFDDIIAVAVRGPALGSGE